jgi:hypothetical protein
MGRVAFDCCTSTRDSLRRNSERLGAHGFPLESVRVDGISRLQSSLDAAARIFAKPFTDKGVYVRAFIP